MKSFFHSNSTCISFSPERTNNQKNKNNLPIVFLFFRYIGNQIWVRGAPKIYTHLMFSILVIAAEQLLLLAALTA
ncbi:hypothetical protein CCP3SC1_200009 [Gammaproteobacteria bacterium]